LNDLLQFIIRHGYLFLFAVVFVEQAGLPVASVPVLLGVGALSADGRYSLFTALLVSLLASLPADIAWYEMGRRGGYKVLRFLCHISLEPDTCVDRTTGSFRRYGSGTLVAAKFVPGLNAVAAPLAGLMHTSLRRFLLLDAAGVALWASFYLTMGFLFRAQLERIAAIIARTGVSLALVAAGGLAGFIAWKWIGRRRFLRRLEMARITPAELMRRIEAGEAITILDLRHAPEVEADGAKLPGALRFAPEELETKHKEIPRDRDIVLYCT
jgi:membrane protein DedA with SNARE-associated domain